MYLNKGWIRNDFKTHRRPGVWEPRSWSCLFWTRLSLDESLNSLVSFLSICHTVKALLYFLVNGINKHFLDFSKGSLLQTPLKTSAIRQQRGLCLPDSWKTQNTEMLFVPQAVLNIVTRFHSLAWCFYWLVRDKTIIFRVLLFCTFKLLRDSKWNADVWASYLP